MSIKAEVGLNRGVCQACAAKVVKSRLFLECTVGSDTGPGCVVVLSKRLSGTASGVQCSVASDNGILG